MKYGYIRVSTAEQNTGRQIKELESHQCDFIFSDKLSGKNTNRPQLQQLIQQLKSGDELIVCSIDRLARSISDLTQLLDVFINEKNISVTFIKENLSFSSNENDYMKRFIFNIFAAIADFNRSLIKATAQDGINTARDAGKYKLTTQQLEELYQMLDDKVAKNKIAQHFNISRQSVYYYINKRG